MLAMVHVPRHDGGSCHDWVIISSLVFIKMTAMVGGCSRGWRDDIEVMALYGRGESTRSKLRGIMVENASGWIEGT